MSGLRILHTADSHIGAALPARPRHTRPRRGDDFIASFRHVLGEAFRAEVDLVIHAGDLFDRSRPSCRALTAAAEPTLLGRVSSHESRPQHLDAFSPRHRRGPQYSMSMLNQSGGDDEWSHLEGRGESMFPTVTPNPERLRQGAPESGISAGVARYRRVYRTDVGWLSISRQCRNQQAASLEHHPPTGRRPLWLSVWFGDDSTENQAYG